MLQSDGALDALELTGGSSFGNPMYLFRGDAPREEFAATLPPHARLGFKLAGAKLMPDYPFEEAYFLPKARRFLEALDMPVILLGGINRLDTVQSALDEGFAFVALARALLRQPDLVNRWQAGTADEGNCIHCNRCMPTIYSGTRCIVDHSEPHHRRPPHHLTGVRRAGSHVWAALDSWVRNCASRAQKLHQERGRLPVAIRPS